MRVFLLALVVFEALGLVGIGVFAAWGDLDAYGREPPAVPVFRPEIYEARIGESVRYRITKDGTDVGYLEYEVVSAVEFPGTNLGREFVIRMTRTRDGRTERSRLMRIRPRAVRIGFLPPRIEEDDDYPSGARPVVKTIRPERVELHRRDRQGRPVTVDGFLIEAVIPRESLSEVKERYWTAPGIPVFGVARWQRGDEMLTVHTMSGLMR